MPSISYANGSQWRKWDLHFHTPSSYDYQFKGASNEQLVQTMVDANVAAFAVTDHHVIDVLRIREMQSIAAGRVTIFPGIELRTDLGGRSLIHMIGIFPEDCDLTDIWTKVSAKFNITAADVTRMGDDRVWVDLRDSAKYIRELGGIVTIHAGHKANTIEGITNSGLYKQELKTNLLTTCIDVLEVGRLEDITDYGTIVFPNLGVTLPACVFSDCHDIRSYKPQIPCWIKADPTFSGLRQIIHEPTDRVFVGDIPPSIKRIRQQPTRVIKSLRIEKTPSTTISEKWFDCTIPLNAELVAIIGNKGSGKSALSDILGLLGNTRRFDSFSFLCSERFRDPKNNKAFHFQASLTWADGTVDLPYRLNFDPPKEAVEKIKYIPQNYLEEICNEISMGDEGKFNAELKAVIFSHISKTDKLDFATLDDLLAHRTEAMSQAIRQFVQQLHEINERIVAAEDRLTPQYRATIDAQLAEKRRELEAHLLTRPVEVRKPNLDSAGQAGAKEADDTLNRRNTELRDLDAKLDSLRADDAAAAKKLATVENLIGKLINLQQQVNEFLSDAESVFTELNLNSSQFVKFSVDSSLLEKFRGEIELQRSVTKRELDHSFPESTAGKRVAKAAEISEIQTRLSGEQRAYQVYLETVIVWTRRTAEITGDEQSVGTIKFLERELRDLNALPLEVKKLEKRRDRKALEIFKEKQKFRDYYKTYYGNAQKFLNEHSVAADGGFHLTFNVSIGETGFLESFLGRLNRRNVGPFMGLDESRSLMKQLINGTNFDSATGTLRFAKNLIKTMKGKENQPLMIRDQLRQGVSIQEIYDYVFALSYLVPSYNLRWDGKTLEQLSPGERGNLLLIFYLLVDQEEIPLVIDQPEENLDNHTVYKTLVPCIKAAKKRRQIIIVTHNPNLAVVCDAEQIIVAKIQKDEANTVTYVCGSIEHPEINRYIVDTLEGTRPAFDKRDDKYLN